MPSHTRHEGHQAPQAEHEVDTAQRREAIRRTSGALSGVYPPGYRTELQEDWPDDFDDRLRAQAERWGLASS